MRRKSAQTLETVILMQNSTVVPLMLILPVVSLHAPRAVRVPALKRVILHLSTSKYVRRNFWNVNRASTAPNNLNTAWSTWCQGISLEQVSLSLRATSQQERMHKSNPVVHFSATISNPLKNVSSNCVAAIPSAILHRLRIDIDRWKQPAFRSSHIN